MELQELSLCGRVSGGATGTVAECSPISLRTSRYRSDLWPAFGGMKAEIEGYEDGGEEKKVSCASFTTLSTVAVQAGLSQLVVSVLKVLAQLLVLECFLYRVEQIRTPSLICLVI